MKNEKLIAMMTSKGINRSNMAVLTSIPATTLNRIINGKTRNVKMSQMQAIADALNTSIYSIFDIPVDLPLAGAIRPEEAGNSITKMLNPDESLILYWYQNSFQAGRQAIYNRAKAEYYKTQNELMNKANNTVIAEHQSDPYEQLVFDLNAPVAE